MATMAEKEQPPLSEILRRAGHRALGGGIPGAMAMGVQVLSLMWLRTTMNYQYRYGTSTTEAMKILYKQGGVKRFYAGLGPALAQGPLSRFGDTAANAGVLALCETQAPNLPVAVKTLLASATAAGWRICLMPIDCVKTTLQVEGAAGMGHLAKKVRNGGPKVLFHGAMGAFGATMAGHYPWFFTFNFLSETIPKPEDDKTMQKLGRNAVIGFSSSVVSDSISNSLRVVKTYKQTHIESVGYLDALKHVVEADGITGLMFRGLKTRIIANGFQGMLFAVIWKSLQEKFFSN